jgi:hypothetical protein
MLQDSQAMIDRLVDLSRHSHPGIRLNSVWALMVGLLGVQLILFTTQTDVND